MHLEPQTPQPLCCVLLSRLPPCPPQAVSYWSKAVRASGNSVVQLQAVIEKSVVLGLATNTASTSNSLAELMTTYASTLATQVGGVASC